MELIKQMTVIFLGTTAIGLLCFSPIVKKQITGSGLKRLLYILSFCFLLISGLLFTHLPSLGAWDLVYLFITVGLNGGVCYAMILGHWYLVVPKLSEQYLLTALKLTVPFLILKIMLSLYAILSVKGNFVVHEGIDSFFLAMIIGMRFLWGYLALIILGIFTWKLVKMRSIQSATGLLYVMVFFLIIGELMASYLYLSYGSYL